MIKISTQNAIEHKLRNILRKVQDTNMIKQKSWEDLNGATVKVIIAKNNGRICAYLHNPCTGKTYCVDEFPESEEPNGK